MGSILCMIFCLKTNIGQCNLQKFSPEKKIGAGGRDLNLQCRPGPARPPPPPTCLRIPARPSPA